jgi:hypothetical protein
MEVLDVLKAIDKGVEMVTPFVGGPLGQALKVIDVTLEAAIAFASGGKDPVAEIQRIHDADPLLQEMKSEWASRIDERFPNG